MSATKRYVIIYTSGSAENIKEGLGWYEILDQVSTFFSSAGGHTPLPNILMLNGKIIVPQRLWDIAYEFSLHRNKVLDIANKNIREKFPEPTP